MNLAGIRQAVERRAGIAYDSASLTEVVNEALASVATEEQWPWLEATWQPVLVAGTQSYTPPAGWTAIRAVTVDGWPYEAKDILTFDSEPWTVGWCVEGDQLFLSPAPGGGETALVRYCKGETDLVLDTDTPFLPAEWHGQVLVNLAAAIVLERLGMWDAADRRRKDYQVALKRMRHRARRERAPRVPRVRPGGGL